MGGLEVAIKMHSRHGGGSFSAMAAMFFFQTFTIGLDLYVIAPLLPAIGKSLHVHTVGLSSLVSSFSWAYAIASPLLGYILDRMTRRSMAIMGLSAFLVGDTLSAAAPGYAVLFAGRVLTGLGAAGFTPALYAYLADRIPVGDRGTMMGYASAGFASATFLGVPIGLLIAGSSDWRRPLWLVVALGLCSMAMTLLAWQPFKKSHGISTGKLPSAFFLNIGVTAAAFTGFSIVYTFLAAHLRVRFHASAAGIASVMSVFGLGGLLGTILWGSAADRWPPWHVIRRGILFEVLCLGLTPFAHQMATAALLWGGFALGAAYTPVLKSLASQFKPRGSALAWNNAAIYLGLAMGAQIAGLAWPWGWTTIIATGASALLLALGISWLAHSAI